MREGKLDSRLVILGVFALVAIGIVAAVLISRAGGEEESTTAAAGAEGCEQVEAAQPKQDSFKAPKQVLEPGEQATAVVATSCGTFEIALDTERAPKTANSFAFLAEEGFYDGLGFHRIVPEFVIQGGDPEVTGAGGPGYSVDEKPPANLAYTRGVVAMAKSSAEPPGRSGSQFYVVTGADAGRPPEYALVGKVGEVRDTWREATVHFAETGGERRRLDLIVRAYDDGIAFRYVVPAQPNLRSLRLAGEVDHSNRPVVARLVAAALDDALRAHRAPAALELDLASPRLLDVPGAVGLRQLAEAGVDLEPHPVEHDRLAQVGDQWLGDRGRVLGMEVDGDTAHLAAVPRERGERRVEEEPAGRRHQYERVASREAFVEDLMRRDEADEGILPDPTYACYTNFVRLARGATGLGCSVARGVIPTIFRRAPPASINAALRGIRVCRIHMP